MKTNRPQLFRKTIPVVKSHLSINYADKYAFMGSCFSQNISLKFNNVGLSVVDTPFGISFNPLSIAHHLSSESYDLFQVSGVNYSWQNHSSIFNKSKDELAQLRKAYINEVSQSAIVFVTFGSAWVYELKETGRVVSNCHKQPNSLFHKRLLTSDEIVRSWKKVLVDFPNQEFIFTVSPVRHWKDGVRENNLSKGVLHQSIDELMKLGGCSYYPSYEIVMDELRDYRFYKDDMIHPNELAIDYIWNHLQETYCDDEVVRLSKRVLQLRNNLNHRPFQLETESHQVFKAKNILESKELNRLIGRKVFE